jgi:hypothetical protein
MMIYQSVPPFVIVLVFTLGHLLEKYGKFKRLLIIDVSLNNIGIDFCKIFVRMDETQGFTNIVS